MIDLELTPATTLLIILVALLLLLLIATMIRFKWQQHLIRRQQAATREVAQRRRIRGSDKEAVFERDNYTCQICGISRDFLDELCPGLGDYLLLEADHIQSVKRGGTGKDIDNLQCLCWRCNRKKGGNKTNQEVRDSIDYGIWYLEE